MTSKLMAVFDTKVKSYTPLHCVRTVEEGIRSFQAAVQQEGNDFNKFAEDFSLWLIGEFDQDSGLLSAEVRPTQIAQALEFRKKAN